MRTLAGAIAMVVFLGAVSTVRAAEAIGWIEHLDKASNTLTLNDGSRYVAASDSVELPAFTIGEKVKVTYSSRDGKMVVTKIRPAI
jgi:hypothetical protein